MLCCSRPGDSTRRHIRAFRLKGYGTALFAICVTLACFVTMFVLLRAQQAGVDNLNVVGEWRGEDGRGMEGTGEEGRRGKEGRGREREGEEGALERRRLVSCQCQAGRRDWMRGCMRQ